MLICILLGCRVCDSDLLPAGTLVGSGRLQINANKQATIWDEMKTNICMHIVNGRMQWSFYLISCTRGGRSG